jgi:predicted nuclease of predicted toxin-antitoxin system
VTIWLDAQISPQLARWIADVFAVDCHHVRDIGLREAEDSEIFRQARAANVVVMTKDEDFVDLAERNGAPPQIIWITCGNSRTPTSNRFLPKLFPMLSR